MINFEYYNPVKIIFGVDESKRIGEVASQIGKTALVLSYDNINFMRKLIDNINELIAESGMKVFNLFNVTANPMMSQVKAGIEICRENNVDVIIAVGGGSVMDAAKTIGIGAKYDGDPWDMFVHGNNDPYIPVDTIPTIMIPTLPATSSEMNNIAVITNDETVEKSYIFNNIVYPKISIVDPKLTCSLPPYQTACGGVDAISHMMEAYFNCVPDTPFQDRLQEGSIITIMELLPQVLKDPNNTSIRASIQWASTLAWNGWLQAGAAPASPMHQIGHVLSSRFGVTHGASLGIVMPGFFKYVCGRRIERFAQFGERVLFLNEASQKETAYKAIEMFEKFIDSVGVQTKLSQVGITADKIEFIASEVEKISCDKEGYLPSDPPVDREDIIKILKLCL